MRGEGEAMGRLRDLMEAEMRLRGFSEATMRMYLHEAHRFAEAHGRSPLKLGAEDCAAYMRRLALCGASPSRLRAAYSSLKFLYRVLRREDAMAGISMPRERKTLPAVMGRDEIQAFLDACPTLRYKTLFALIYSTGLRISEALALRPGDLDFGRKQVFVRSGKGGRDRYAILGDKAALLLRRYLAAARPLSWLFFGGMGRETRLAKRSAQNAFKGAASRAGLRRELHVHTLRHSFATHLLEDGANLVMTTIRYLHLQRLDLLGVRSPIDDPAIDPLRRAPDENGQFSLELAS
jgi:integrase/recombinase XerD